MGEGCQKTKGKAQMIGSRDTDSRLANAQGINAER
jgi:hypothetical protein